MTVQRRSLSATFRFGILLMLAGCAAQFPADPQEWREATVQYVMPLSALPFYVDRRCTQPPTNQTAEGTRDVTVVLVKYRVGRNPYPHAFEMGDSLVLAPGDLVSVQPRGCGIRRR